MQRTLVAAVPLACDHQLGLVNTLVYFGILGHAIVDQLASTLWAAWVGLAGRKELLTVDDHQLQLCCQCSPLRDVPLAAHNGGGVLQHQRRGGSQT